MRLKIFAGFIIFILILNLVLLGLGRINDILFWLIIIACAFIAFKVIPKIRQ